MKGKIIEAFYDEEYGVSWVVKQNKYGVFIGASTLSEEDKEYANSWDGQRFAEFKADREALKAKIKVMKQRLVGMRTAYKSLLQNTDYEDPTMKKFYKQINAFEKQVKELEDKYTSMVDNYLDFTDRVLKQRENFKLKQEAKRDFLKKLEETTE